jgi:hypothetical protein
MSVSHSLLRLAGLYCLILAPMFGQDPQSATSFHWGDAIIQSAGFLALEHGVRIAAESDTRAGLKGPFVRGHLKSVGSLHGWGDGDPFLVNYVGHPAQGAVSGYIQVQNDPRYRRVEFGSSRDYWKSRLRALAWSAAYSTQFEIGLISEASLGNAQSSPGHSGVVDLVVTPMGGLAVMIAEDALDRFVVRRFENWTQRRLLRVLVRGLLNPNRALANMLRGQVPWSRDNRPDVTVP